MLEQNLWITLSPSAKLLYFVINARRELIKDNNWVEDDGREYILLTNKEAVILTGQTEPTIIKSKKELEAAGIIELEGQKGSRPQRYYIKFE